MSVSSAGRTVGRTIVRAALLAALAGCGGGGGGGGGGGSPPPPGGIAWTQNVFQSSASFENRCATVRTGVDAEGHTFPDIQGTLAHELFFLRSWTRETYLWNTEVVDQNPNTFTDKVAYFNTLKTSATTASGKAKDQFHFNLLTSDYLAQVLAAPSATYGAEFRIFAGSVPRDVRVLYTQAGTPATDLLSGTPKLIRGARLLTIDGVDVVNGGVNQTEIDTLNNGTFPLTAGETHSFTVRYPDNSTRSFTLTSANISEKAVNRTAVVSTPSGNVGYMLLNTFGSYASEKEIMDAIVALKGQNVNDVVIDLRYNGGGLLAVSSQLGFQLAGASRTTGKVFERLQFNAAAGSSNPVTGGANSPTGFYTTGLGFSVANGTPLQSLNLPRVFVLSTASTCSASEAVINGLRGIDVDVVQIGGTTCGKPYGFYAQDNCGRTYFSVQFKGINDKSFGDYADGFSPANSASVFAVKVPGCSVADDLSHELGDSSESMLSAALGYRQSTTCPAATGTSLSPQRVPGSGLPMEDSGRTEAATILRNMRDLHLPPKGSNQ